MKTKILVLLIILILLSGCVKVKDDILPLDFFEVSKVMIKDLQVDSIDIVIQEKKINNNLKAFLYNTQDNKEINAGIKLNDKYFNIGQVSMDNTSEDLMGIEELEVFGRKTIKFYGILGANYAKAFYWFIEDDFQNIVIQVDGNIIEIDLDDDNKREIISTLGTIPKTKIYKLEKDKILVTDINKSIDAKSVIMKDRDKKLFEMYFEANKPEEYIYYKDSFYKQH